MNPFDGPHLKKLHSLPASPIPRDVPERLGIPSPKSIPRRLIFNSGKLELGLDQSLGEQIHLESQRPKSATNWQCRRLPFWKWPYRSWEGYGGGGAENLDSLCFEPLVAPWGLRKVKTIFFETLSFILT